MSAQVIVDGSQARADRPEKEHRRRNGSSGEVEDKKGALLQ